jgi:isoleucyl-tRNA synthetase
VYSPVDPKADFPAQEEAVLAFWQRESVFRKSVTAREGCPEYVFYDGPPFATGLPHFGHFLPSTIKDIIPRYQTMKGKKVERRFGWDCHGLPVEHLIEKELGLNSKTDIERYGVARFNEACRASVLRYAKEWQEAITRLGRWVDFENGYKTMDPDYMESVWWVVKWLWEKGLLYEGSRILPYCPRCSTVLSNHELNLGVYKDVHDPALTVRFRALSAPFADADIAGGRAYLLAWTTTPWTLPSNLGLAAGPDIDYVKVQDGDECYILAESRLSAYYKAPAECRILWKKKGAELAGTAYEPLFPYFAGAPNAFRVLTGGFVSTEDGTGIVHIAPGFGEDDYDAFKGTGVPAICPVDAECRFTEEVPDYAGRFVKDCDKDIMERLKREGTLVKRDQILHAYPHCWRCGSPLIYRAVGSWFVAAEKLRGNMLAANSQIDWQPAHIQTGRFGKWLEGARDWAVSRNRYWGNPIPVWKCPDCSKAICVGSRQELQSLSGVYPEDLHKHFVDDIVIPCACGGAMRRVPEVLDCWFESGAMPYAQNHYPFENREYVERRYPADFISEGLDQTRGWFYTLTVLAAALFDRPAFRHCIVSGLVLAADGKKMSKSLRNYTDPAEAIGTFGADAIRLFLMRSPAAKADDLRYSDDGVRDVVKSVLLPLWNSYSFFITYANIDGFTASGRSFGAEPPANPLDRWILSVTQRLVRDATSAFDAYDLPRVAEQIAAHIDQLNNWYIRRSRRRFWKSENDGDKLAAYETLYQALKTFALVAAPVTPFVAESVWRNLRLPADAESVHLALFPEYDAALRDEALEFRMATAQKAVSLGRSLRYQHGLKIRQPLLRAEFATRDPREMQALREMEASIREELNVKQVVFHEREEELVEYRAKANFRALGKALGSRMTAAAAEIARLGQERIRALLDGAALSLDIAGQTVEVSLGSVVVERLEKARLKAANEGTLTVALDPELTDGLRREGCARDLIHGIQNLRKELGYAISDRIALGLNSVGESGEPTPEQEAVMHAFGELIGAETLASELRFNEVPLNVPPQNRKTVATETGMWRVEIVRLA